MRFLILFLSLLLVQASSFGQKQIAITFDDLPMALPRISLQHTIDVNERLVAGLKDEHVPAIGFVNEGEIVAEDETAARVGILKLWVQAGFDLGNHTVHHVDYDGTPYNDFVEELNKGAFYTKKVLQEHNKKLKYFRPPFLSTGSTLEKKEKLEKLLRDNGYTMALSTIESSDFTFNLIYLKAKFEGDSVLMKKAVKNYLDFTEKKILYFENLTKKVSGAAIPQILLVHVNDINADNLSALLNLFKAHNYEFISLDKALENPFYHQKDTYVGKRGISWIHRLNLENRKVLMKQEPKLPIEIKKQNKAAKEDQFFFLFKARILGYNYSLLDFTLISIIPIIFTLIIYLIIARRKRKKYQLQ